MAMKLCIDEKDEERESEVQSDVRAKKRARERVGGGGEGVGRGEVGGWGARASSPSRLTEPHSLALHLSR